MKDKLGIEICCEKCRYAIWTKSMPRIFVKCEAGNCKFEYERCRLDFRAHYKALATRIFELQNDKDYLDKIAKYHADLGGASLADLLDDYSELDVRFKVLTKLLEKKSFELGELQARVVAKNECIKAYKSKLVEAEKALEHRNAELEAAYEQLSNFVDNDKYPELYADFQTNAKTLAKTLERVEELESRKPRAKRLVWRYIKLKNGIEEWEGNIERFPLSVVKSGENFIVWLDDDELDLPSFDTIDEAKQAAQDWLDKLVEECAEYDDKNQQKQVSTTNGTSESEAQK
nr:MAG TPA: hypothetical protein [Caudoviricetes sp.]